MHAQSEERVAELAGLIGMRMSAIQEAAPPAPAPAVPAPAVPAPVYHQPDSQHGAKGAGADVCDVFHGSAPQVRCCDCSRVVCRRCADAGHTRVAFSAERCAQLHHKLQNFDSRRSAPGAAVFCGLLTGLGSTMFVAIAVLDNLSLSDAFAMCAGVLAFSGPIVVGVQWFNINNVVARHTKLVMKFARTEVV